SEFIHAKRREHNKKRPRLKEIISVASIVNNYGMLCFRLPSGEGPPFRAARSREVVVEKEINILFQQE
ncbi:MAG: hypothetical protein LBB66_06090, partial [Desulfovibrio sp.]|nr:hypothetical protein [Desulfovibrio sp.]